MSSIVIPKLPIRPDNLEIDELFTPRDEEAELSHEKMMKTIKMLSDKGYVCFPLGKKKRPSIKEWKTIVSTDIKMFTESCTAYALIAGEKSNVTIIDIDTGKDDVWGKLLSHFDEEGLFSGYTIPRVKTPSGGYHYFFQYNDLIGTGSNVVKVYSDGRILESGIDTRNDGGYVVGPNSLYSASNIDKEIYNGIPYEWEIDFSDVDWVLPEIPEWLLQVLTTHDVSINDDWIELNIKTCKKATKSSISDWNKPSKILAEFVIDSVNASRATNRDDWRNGVWAIASLEVPWGLTLADRFSRRTTSKNYGGVEGIYEQSKGTITWGTIISWLKEDNSVAYSEYLNSIREEEMSNFSSEMLSDLAIGTIDEHDISEKTIIDREDPYTFYEFRKFYSEHIFSSRSEFNKSFAKDVNRVLAVIVAGQGTIIKKDDLSVGLFNEIRGLEKTINDFNIRWMFDKDSLSDKEKETLELWDDLIDEEKKLSSIETKDEGALKTVKSKMEKEQKRVNKINDKLNSILSVRISSLLERYVNKYATLVNDPDEPKNSKNLNIWTGYKAKKVDKVDDSLISPVLNFFKEVWCSNDETMFNYLMKWFAFICQKPGQKSKVACVAISGQGCGKGTMYDFFRDYIFGSNLMIETNDVQQVTGEKNSQLFGQKMIILDDIGHTKDEFRGMWNKMKNFVTEPTYMHRKMYKDSQQIKNIMEFIIFSNHKDSIILENDDRRYFVLEISDIHKNDQKWFGNLRKQIMNQIVGDHFFTYLMNYNVGDYMGPIPSTKLKDEMKNISLTSHARFVNQLIEQLDMEDEDRDDAFKGFNKTSISSSLLYKTYEAWCDYTGEKNKASLVKFGMALSNMFIKERSKKGIMYKLKV